MLKKLDKITFVGFVLCLAIPIVEVKYRYRHSNGYSGPNDQGIGIDLWNSFTEHWDDINFLFGFHPEVIVIPLAIVIQGIILLKNKAPLQKVGIFLNHYRTYVFLLIAIGINLYLIADAYTHHVTKFYFWFGAYIFFGLIVINVIVKLAMHIYAKKEEPAATLNNQF
ncbi:MAG: hypothetical protein GQ574_25055 [Crocinitomix sp.]|nr:hypothetical protein [Crocinitomix sp.]